MIKFIKWTALIVLFPILLIKEIISVTKEMDMEIPDPDDLLSEAKKAAKQGKEIEIPEEYLKV